MTTVIPWLEALGAASLAGFWGPVAIWTVLWAAVALGLRLAQHVDPALRYRGAQASLFALPVGLALAAIVPVPDLVPARVMWEAAPLVGATLPIDPAVTAPTPAPTVPGGPAVTVSLFLGLASTFVAAVAVVALLRLVVQSLAVRRLRRELPPAAVDAKALAGDVSAAADLAGLRRAPPVVVTSAEVTPMTLGVRRPVVVVPASLDRGDRRLALAHEFVHVVRRDPLAQLAEAATAAAFAAHPAVRHLARECALLRELACDADVLAAPDIRRSAYATLVCAFAATPTRPPAQAVGIVGGPLHVHQRLLAMTTRPRPLPVAARWAAAAALLIALGAATTSGRALAQTPAATPASVAHVEVPDDAVVFVDGERVDGAFSSLGLDPAELRSVEVFRGGLALARFGADPAAAVATRAGTPAPAPSDDFVVVDGVPTDLAVADLDGPAFDRRSCGIGTVSGDLARALFPEADDRAVTVVTTDPAACAAARVRSAAWPQTEADGPLPVAIAAVRLDRPGEVTLALINATEVAGEVTDAGSRAAGSARATVSPRGGVVRVPVSALSPGVHTVRIRDVVSGRVVSGAFTAGR